MMRIALNGATMGTRYSVVAYARPAFDAQTLGQKLHAAISEVDAVMSNWKPDSDINRLNRAAVGEWVELPPGLLSVLRAALAIEAQSCGAFDIGVGATVGAWGFGPYAGAGSVHSPVPRPVTRQALELDQVRGRARKHAPLCLDLSGIAKGFGVDRLAEMLRSAGLSSWLVSIDGEVRAGAPKPDGTRWAIGIEQPVVGRRDLSGVIEIADMAIATSGTYRHCREERGRIVSHTIDPASGCPVEGKLASVTVLAPTCMEADAWATAILVEGRWPASGFVTPTEIDALVLTG